MTKFYKISHNSMYNRGFPWISEIVKGLDHAPACSRCGVDSWYPSGDIAHWPEPDDVSAFKKEAELIESVGGKDAPNLLNEINSPGKKKL